MKRDVEYEKKRKEKKEEKPIKTSSSKYINIFNIYPSSQKIINYLN